MSTEANKTILRRMKFKLRRLIVGISLVAGLVLSFALVLDVSTHQSTLEASRSAFCKTPLHGENFARTELFFGLSKPDGSVVTEKEFQRFIDDKVTPLFPDGLTLLTGMGQFKNSNATVVKEGSKLLVVLYPFNPENHKKIEQIRNTYRNAFHQNAVLRVDEPSCVSF